MSKLIQCPDCGADVSARAVACPKCAAPLGAKEKQNAMAALKTEQVLASIVIIVSVVLGMYFWHMDGSPSWTPVALFNGICWFVFVRIRIWFHH